MDKLERIMREECILVDENDRVLGPNSKKSCHLNSNIDADNSIDVGKLHRAFSIFLFDTKVEQAIVLWQDTCLFKNAPKQSSLFLSILPTCAVVILFTFWKS